MKFVLAVVGLGGFVAGVILFAEAKDAVREIQGLLALIIGTTGFAGAGVIEAIDRLAKSKQAEAKQPAAAPLTATAKPG